MALKPGTRLGSYEVTAPIGAGGMGEVYRARDTKLDRDVAIKVLPGHLISNEEAMARFEREAKAIATLSHPNILAIHDFGSDEGTVYAVTELLDGKTLRERLAGGGMGVRKSIEVARQIALGLGAAHQKGIIHRDLKPENIMITRDGRGKILDFGLAVRSMNPAGARDDTQTPTKTSLTDPGSVMGTVGYMSPEQVRGEPADARSDIFSFGVVLYEMLTERRAFSRETAAETMTAILREEPADPASTGAHVPQALVALMHRCMEKLPDERFHSAADVAFALEAIMEGSSSGTQAMAAIESEASRSRMGWARAVAAVLLAAVAFAAGRMLAPVDTPEREPTFQQQTFRRGNVVHARFGPDGKTIFYSASWGTDPFQIYMTRTDGRESRPLELLNADVLSTSAAGEMAVLLKERFLGTTMGFGTLARVPLTGGAPREIQVDVGGADWGPDGELALIRVVDEAHILEYPQGTVLLTERNASISAPRVSPDGEQVAFVEQASYGGENRVMLVDRSGEQHVLSVWPGVDPDSLAWSPDGSEIVFAAAVRGGVPQLRAVSLSGRERLLLASADAHLPHDIAPDGRLLVERESWQQVLRYRSPADDADRDLSWLDASVVNALSADGSLILFSERGRGGGGGGTTYLRKSDGSPPIRLGEGYALDLSADGAWALLDPDTTDRSVLLVPTGVGQSREIPLEGPLIVAIGFTNDGQRVAYVALNAEGAPQTWEHDLESGKSRELLPGVKILGGALSPDDRLLASQAADGKLLIYPVEGGESHTVQGAEDGDEPVQWSTNGRFLFVTRAGEIPQRIWRIDRDTGRREIWKELIPDDPVGVLRIEGLALSADGETYAFSYSLMTSSALYVVDGLWDPAPAR